MVEKTRTGTFAYSFILLSCCSRAEPSPETSRTRTITRSGLKSEKSVSEDSIPAPLTINSLDSIFCRLLFLLSDRSMIIIFLFIYTMPARKTTLVPIPEHEKILYIQYLLKRQLCQYEKAAVHEHRAIEIKINGLRSTIILFCISCVVV